MKKDISIVHGGIEHIIPHFFNAKKENKMETLSSKFTTQEIVQQRADIPDIEALPQPDEGQESVLALPQWPQESQVSLSLKAAGMVLLTVPFLTVTGFLFQAAQFREELPSLDMLTIDWEKVPGILLEMGIGNLIGLPILFYVAAALSFGFARLLKGRGGFGRHTYLVAVASFKVILLAGVLSFLMLLTPAAGILSLGLYYLVGKLFNDAIVEAHSITRGHGCLVSLSMFIVPALVIAVALLLGPVLP
jgi:hypothetical protein